MDCDTFYRISDHYTFACMQAGSDFEAESADRLTDRDGASNRPDRPRLPVESCEHSVAGRPYFSSPGRAKLSAERCVIVTQHFVPAVVAQQRDFLS
jgi:hypothetical protein